MYGSTKDQKIGRQNNQDYDDREKKLDKEHFKKQRRNKKKIERENTVVR